MAFNRVAGREQLYVGGVFALRKPELLEEQNITSVLSVIKYSFAGWGERAKRFKHLSIDVDDMEEEDLLVHLSSAVRFIENGLYPGNDGKDNEEQSVPRPGEEVSEHSPGAVYVHCAMGKSRSVTCVIAYLLWKYPHRFGGKQFVAATASAAQRRDTAQKAVVQALNLVQETRPFAEPNPGFMRQLELWWEMGCPTDSDTAVENHPVYQRWLYENKLKEARDLGTAPGAEWIIFEDETQDDSKDEQVAPEKQLRCKKCRRVLANSRFVVEHQGTKNSKTAATPCPHIFVETLSWMRPALEDGALDGRLLCPNAKCNANVGRFAWQGFKCSCGEWICPAFSLNRSRVDEVNSRNGNADIRQPPARSGNL